MADGDLTFGQRLRAHRERRGMTRAVLGGLVGKSDEWVKAVESGRLLTPHLPMLTKLARVLQIKDISDLVGDVHVPVRLFAGPGHPALPAVRAALPLPHLQARLDAAWQARATAVEHKSALAPLLPDLIRDAQYAVKVYEGNERRKAQAILARTFNLTQVYLAFQPVPDLVWRVADKGMTSAQDSGDLRAIASAAWFLTAVHRETGNWDTARSINAGTVQVIEPHLRDEDTDLLGWWGSLHVELARTAARAGEAWAAWRHFDDAERVARRLPATYFEPATAFSARLLGYRALRLDVELQRPGEALGHARRIDLNALRPLGRGWVLVDTARAHHMRGDLEQAVETLRQAYREAPEYVRYNEEKQSPQIISEALAGPPALRAKANELAIAAGKIW